MTDAVIKCDSVYKIFGANAKKMLQEANGNVDAKTFQENGCIVGVNNASFEVSKGEMLVVMGLSGSGKSTLLRCISRLTDATDGKIYIEGQDLLTLNNKELIDLRRNKMGIVTLLASYHATFQPPSSIFPTSTQIPKFPDRSFDIHSHSRLSTHSS